MFQHIKTFVHVQKMPFTRNRRHCVFPSRGRGCSVFTSCSAIANAFRLLGSSWGYFPPPGSHYLDKCDALSTEIKCCAYKRKCVVNSDLLFLKKKKDFNSAWASAWWHLSKWSQIQPDPKLCEHGMHFLSCSSNPLMFCRRVHSHQEFQDEKLVLASKT